MNDNIHIPVLVDEVLHYLAPDDGDDYLDLTAGYGGHAELVGKKIGSEGTMTLVDRDVQAIEHLAERFENDRRVQIYHNDYLEASRGLLEIERKYDCILADIGVSSPHLDNPNRGFSFMSDGPLDMRMDTSQELTAEIIVNQWSDELLVKILYDFGEVKGSRLLAADIVANRPIRSTNELTAIINKRTRYSQRMRVCAQVFQALRVAVNDELGQLRSSMPLWASLLKPGGRLAVITFHSLEDRIVKQYFAEHGGNRYDAELKLLTKGPVTCSESELAFNPRARSAKLRVSQRK